MVARYLEPPTFLSGGGGLVSTAADYLRFAQMLLNGGELDGIRILSPLTVDLMRRNQLPREVKEISPGVGFGLDFAVIDDPVAADGISRASTSGAVEPEHGSGSIRSRTWCSSG